jgi:hypothetical protein
VATLHYFLGLGLDEVAGSIGIPQQVAEAELDRATGSFRFALGMDDAPELEAVEMDAPEAVEMDEPEALPDDELADESEAFEEDVADEPEALADVEAADEPDDDELADEPEAEATDDVESHEG